MSEILAHRETTFKFQQLLGHFLLKWQRGESPNLGSAGDLANWESNFGASGGALAAGVGAIPEPSTALLAGIVGLLLVGHSRRRVAVC